MEVSDMIGILCGVSSGWDPSSLRMLLPCVLIDPVPAEDMDATPCDDAPKCLMCCDP